VTILDWYHAAEHVHAYAAAGWPRDPTPAGAWADRAKGVLYDRGGAGFLAWVRDQE